MSCIWIRILPYGSDFYNTGTVPDPRIRITVFLCPNLGTGMSWFSSSEILASNYTCPFVSTSYSRISKQKKMSLKFDNEPELVPVPTYFTIGTKSVRYLFRRFLLTVSRFLL